MELKQEYYRAVIFYDFKVGLDQEECLQRLQSAYGEENPSRAAIL